MTYNILLDKAMSSSLSRQDCPGDDVVRQCSGTRRHTATVMHLPGVPCVGIANMSMRTKAMYWGLE